MDSGRSAWRGIRPETVFSVSAAYVRPPFGVSGPLGPVASACYDLLRYMWVFAAFSVLGWLLEVFFRRYVSQGKWQNPGFMEGPWLPIYGCGAVLLYLVSSFGLPWWAYLAIYPLGLTLLEYFGGLFLLKVLKLRLWDYSNQWGNVQGLVCPVFSVAWTVAGFLFTYLLYPGTVLVLTAIEGFYPWLLLLLGAYCGIFGLDLVVSLNIVAAVAAVARRRRVFIDLERAKYFAALEHQAQKGRKHRSWFALRTMTAVSDINLFLAPQRPRVPLLISEDFAARTRLGRRTMLGVRKSEKARSGRSRAGV